MYPPLPTSSQPDSMHIFSPPEPPNFWETLFLVNWELGPLKLAGTVGTLDVEMTISSEWRKGCSFEGAGNERPLNRFFISPRPLPNTESWPKEARNEAVLIGLDGALEWTNEGCRFTPWPENLSFWMFTAGSIFRYIAALFLRLNYKSAADRASIAKWAGPFLCQYNLGVAQLLPSPWPCGPLPGQCDLLQQGHRFLAVVSSISGELYVANFLKPSSDDMILETSTPSTHYTESDTGGVYFVTDSGDGICYGSEHDLAAVFCWPGNYSYLHTEGP